MGDEGAASALPRARAGTVCRAQQGSWGALSVWGAELGGFLCNRLRSLEPGAGVLEVGAVSSPGCAWSAGFLLLPPHVSGADATDHDVLMMGLITRLWSKSCRLQCQSGTGKTSCPETLETHCKAYINKRLLQPQEPTSHPDHQFHFKYKALWSLEDTAA